MKVKGNILADNVPNVVRNADGTEELSNISRFSFNQENFYVTQGSNTEEAIINWRGQTGSQGTSGVTFTDGANTYSNKSEVNFNDSDFYLTADSTGNPVLNIDRGFSGALVDLTADESISSNSLTIIPWDAEIYDYGNWWDSGSPTRFTVPNGVESVRITCNLMWLFAATTSTYMGQILYNGSAVDGLPRSIVGPVNTADGGTLGASISLFIPRFFCKPGDYFEIRVRQIDSGSGALSIDSNVSTWFSIEKVY